MGVKVTIPAGSPFTIKNIPFNVISTRDNTKPRCATAIGDYAIDLAVYSQHGHLDDLEGLPLETSIIDIFTKPCLNGFAALPHSFRNSVRKIIIKDITEARIEEQCLIPLSRIEMHLPMQIGGYSDLYCSLEHSQNCSSMAAGAAIPVNWFYTPCVYNSRVSSIIPSPQPVRRPKGVYFKDGDNSTYGRSQELDYELEMGYFMSKPIEFGSVLNIAEAEEHIFGLSRDLQLFEMNPLGPFHGKGFGTSISTWVVTMDALEDFRCFPKTKQDPPPFDHLKWPREGSGAIDINLQVTLIRNRKRFALGTSNLKYLYCTPFQQITHHASAMCGLATGDLLGTGTVSGDAVDDQGSKRELGCLYEATQAGDKFVTLSDGTQMKYLQDHDEIVLDAWCGSGDGTQRVLGFGECRGRILPSL